MAVRDADGFDEFYRSTRQRTISCLYMLTGDLAEAQDVAQEAYSRAWQRWATIGDYGDVEAWVRTVARRIAFSSWRKARNRILAHRRHGPPEVVPAPSEDSVVVVEALQTLPAGQREALALFYLAGRSVEEISQETGVPAGTVKARLSRGRAALTALLTVGDREFDRV